MNAPIGFSVSSGAPRFFVPRVAILFCAPMLVNGIALPFFPVWLETLSMSDFEIGMVLAVPLLIRVITAPLAGLVADRIGERTQVLIWSGWLSLLTGIALFAAESFWPVLLLYSLQGAVYGPYFPIADSIALTGVRRWNFDYGRMRFWGSLAFIAATMAGGWLSGLYGGAIVLPAMAVGFVATIVAAVQAPKTGRPRRPHAMTALASAPINALRQKDVLLMMIGASIVNSSHAMLFAFSAIYWHKLGFTGTEIGLLWSAGVLAEILFFIFAARLRRRFDLWTLMFFGSTVAVIRWMIFPAEMGFVGFFALQCLHAFTYACVHIGVQNRIVERVAEEQEASAQGLYFFYNGVFLALMTFLSGYFFNWYGTGGFYLMSVTALVGTALLIAAKFHQPHKSLSGG
ncbi:MAG: MFS transporter [Shinella sp.]|nr:MFS transporter [Shinella sp.]